MDKETYEALKRIIDDVGERHFQDDDPMANDVQQIEGWIDEVAKEYSD